MSAIEIKQLGKMYRIGDTQVQHETFAAALLETFKKPIQRGLNLLRGNAYAASDMSTDFWALRNLSLDVNDGETLGIIGRNGSGKSTLLKILSRITEPTEGYARVSGRISSLLEVGTGFNMELTGRENLYLNGSILGMSIAEIDRKFEDITEFAGIGEFLDTPVKHYSSGMKVRLGFSVAAHLEPEILLIDEVLAVGDYAFQKKSLDKMRTVTKSGRTVLFVSHQLDMVREICDRVLLLNEGKLERIGYPDEIIRYYVESFSSERSTKSSFTCALESDRLFQILSGRLVNKAGIEVSSFDIFEPVTVEIEYILNTDVVGLNVGAIFHHNGSRLFLTWDTDYHQERLEHRSADTYKTSFTIPAPLLKAGYYEIELVIGIIKGRTQHHRLKEILSFNINAATNDRPRSFSQDDRAQIALNLNWETVQTD